MVTRHEINTVRSAADSDTVKKKHSFEQTGWTIFKSTETYSMTD